MSNPIAGHLGVRPPVVGAIGVVAVLPMLAAICHEPVVHRMGVAAAATPPVLLSVTQSAHADFAATPAVTSPQRSVARFSIFPLPTIEGVVGIRRCAQVALGRFGGLHGP